MQLMKDTSWHSLITKNYGTIANFTLITEGLSSDKKYKICMDHGICFFLRVNDWDENGIGQLYNFSVQKWIYDNGAPIHKPIEAGICSEGVYELFEWIEGSTLMKIDLDKLNADCFQLGLRVGNLLKNLHASPLPPSKVKSIQPAVIEDMYVRFPKTIKRILRKFPKLKKIGTKLLRYVHSSIIKRNNATSQFKHIKRKKVYNAYVTMFKDDAECANVEFMNTLKYIMKNKSTINDHQLKQVITHWDCSLGNIIETQDGALKFIDVFSRNKPIMCDYMFDVARFAYGAYNKPNLRNGFIVGYFERDPTDEEWLLLKVKLFWRIFVSLNDLDAFCAWGDLDLLKARIKSLMNDYNGSVSIVPSTWGKSKTPTQER